MSRENVSRARRWIIKIGSSLLTDGGQGLDHQAIAQWCAQISALRSAGVEVVLVSSGAVAEGMARLGMRKRPVVLHELQAVAAVGQMGLVRAWELGFEKHGIRAAQVLLTHDDVADRGRYLNARATINALIGFGAVAVVNENDTVSTDEIRLGDNDTLGGLTASLIEADLMVILTDQNGLFDQDPRANPDAKLISEISLSAPELYSMAGDSKGELGRGGMRTKVSAAGIAARAGAATVIAHGKAENVLTRLLGGETLGTLISPDAVSMTARKRWIAGQRQVRGKLILDQGAATALRKGGKSLLPVGVTALEGHFGAGDMVSCVDPAGLEVARGLCNYSSADALKILGARRSELFERLGQAGEPALIHCDNLTLST